MSLVSRKTSQIRIKAGSDAITLILRSWQGQVQMHIGFKVSKRQFLKLLAHINVKVVQGKQAKMSSTTGHRDNVRRQSVKK